MGFKKNLKHIKIKFCFLLLFSQSEFFVKNLFHLSLLLNGFPIKKAQEAFDKILSIPENEYENYVFDKRKEIVEFHLKNNAYYQNFVGTSYFDEVQNAVTAGLSSTVAMKNSTETAQF